MLQNEVRRSGERPAAITGWYDFEEEEFEKPGRLRSEEEYLKVLQSRADIFHVENDRQLKKIQVVSVTIGIIFGLWLETVEIPRIPPEFMEKVHGDMNVTMAKSALVLPAEKPPEPEIKAPKKLADAVAFAPPKHTSGRCSSGNHGGDPSARMTKVGVLGILSGAIKGSSVATADPAADGGYMDQIDAMISGVGNLKQGGGGVGRRGLSGIGYGDGTNSGFSSNGSGGVEDIVGGLMQSSSAALDLHQRHDTRILSDGLNGVEQACPIVGGRNKAGIQRIVMQNSSALRYAYNRELRSNPELKGKITVNFAIDEFGVVIFCKVVNSTIDNKELEQEIIEKIRRWAFDKIDKPGDVTEVTYPFVFTP